MYEAQTQRTGSVSGQTTREKTIRGGTGGVGGREAKQEANGSVSVTWNLRKESKRLESRSGCEHRRNKHGGTKISRENDKRRA